MEKLFSLPSPSILLAEAAVLLALFFFARRFELRVGRQLNHEELLRLRASLELLEASIQGRALARIRFLAFEQAEFPAWGFSPHFSPRTILLASELLNGLSPSFIASTIVHEQKHATWLPLVKSTWWGERAAYRAQSDFLNAHGINGTVNELQRRFPECDPTYLEDLRISFEEYKISTPAVY